MTLETAAVRESVFEEAHWDSMDKMCDHSPATDEQKELAGTWEVWDSTTHPQEPEGSAKFHFDYSNNFQERVWVTEGTALLTPDDGSDPVTITAGEFVVFHQGFKCWWHVTTPMKKHYCYYDKEGAATALSVNRADWLSGNATVSNSIACDLCGANCTEATLSQSSSGSWC